MNTKSIKLPEVKLRDLSFEVDSGRLSHAVLITGATEKLRAQVARLTASALLCTAAADRPCGRCSNCIKSKKSVHPDISEISGEDKARSIKKESVSLIRQQAYVIPNEAAERIFIILEAQNMTEEAQNAMLKILEEPPRFVRFILSAASSEGLLETIRSRVRIFDLGEEATQDKQTKAQTIACEIAKALCTGDEYDLVIASAPIKKDRRLLKNVCDELGDIFLEMLKLRKSGFSKRQDYPSTENEALAVKLYRSVSPALLFKWTGTLSEIAEMAELNANETLLVTQFCSRLSTDENELSISI
jgi:hypothetical protein